MGRPCRLKKCDKRITLFGSLAMVAIALYKSLKGRAVKCCKGILFPLAVIVECGLDEVAGPLVVCRAGAAAEQCR